MNHEFPCSPRNNLLKKAMKTGHAATAKRSNLARWKEWPTSENLSAPLLLAKKSKSQTPAKKPPLECPVKNKSEESELSIL